jgi:membrane-bound lytic murein transglycosylase B
MRFLTKILFILLLPVTSVVSAADKPHAFEDKTAINQFIDEMVKEHKFDRKVLTSVFDKARLHPSIIKAISKPAESKPWYAYREIFLTKGRIEGGVKFWNENKDILKKVSEKYGVPEQIMIAIIGVETRYGKHKGSYPVIDALSTLAFAYPPRSKFFRSELKQFLIMTREESIDPLEQKGSYAGAMGMPQFISSSFRHYAVDFDEDGQRDLWNNVADAAGSVGNYFSVHGWKKGQPIATKVKVSGLKYRDLIDGNLKPRYSADELRLAGVALPGNLPMDLRGTLIALDSGDGPEYWVVWHNFYVISRYNHSALYAMAVYQLSNEIVDSRQ